MSPRVQWSQALALSDLKDKKVSDSSTKTTVLWHLSLHVPPSLSFSVTRDVSLSSSGFSDIGSPDGHRPFLRVGFNALYL